METRRRTGLLLAIALFLTSPVRAAIFGVPTNLNAAGQVTAASVDPPGWLVLERLNSGSANGDVVHQIRFFVEVTGTTLDVRVFDPGLGSPTTVASGARDLGNPVTYQYRLLSPSGGLKGVLTIAADTAATENTLVRFACQDANTTALFNAVNAGASATNRIWGAGGGGTNCAPLAAGLYIFEATATTTATVEGTNAFGVEFVDSTGNPYNAYTIGNADDTIATVAATDTSMVTGGVAGDKPTANVSGYTAFFPYVNRGCSINASNFDLDADNAEGNGSVATIVDTLGASTTLARSNNDDVATTAVTVESSTVANPVSNNYGMYTLTTQLDEWATAQNHVDWRVADFQGQTAGGATASGGQLPFHPTSAIRMYLPNSYSGCSTSGCTLTAPQEPVLAGSAVLTGGENPPLPGGATTNYALTATVANPGTSAITNVQITIPIAANVTFVSQTSTIDGAAAACVDTSTGTFRRCTFASLAAGSYASLTIDVTFQPAATGLRNLTGAPAAGAPPPDTTVWAQYTPASQSATFTRTETLGPICQLSVNAATSIDLQLRAPNSGITDAPDPVTAGNNVTYTYRINTLAGTATNPSITQVLPAGTTFVSATAPGGWTCVSPPVGSGGTVRCSAATQGTGNSNFTIVVQVPSTVANGTVLSSTATVASANVDPDTTNNSLTMTTTVASPTAQADLSITKTDSPDPAAAGRDIAYTLTVANAGPATAINVVLSESVPAGTTFRSIGSAQAWSCTTPAVGGTGAISCTLPALAAGTNSVLILRVRINAAGLPPASVSNTASVTSAVADPAAGNNTSGTVTTTVGAANSCPTPGKSGAGGTLAGTVNTYYPGTGTSAAGSTSITLGTSRGAATPIAVGDLLLIIQMQDATINTTDTDAYGDGTAGDGEARGATAQNSTGRYEYAVAASAVPVGGGTLTVSQPLFNTYTTAAATTTLGQKRFQVVRVPQYTTATLGSTLTSAYWDGSSGGVLAFDVQNALALGGATVDLSGRGFRGGGARQLAGSNSGGTTGTGTDYVSLVTQNFHGSKGEGTAGTPRFVYDPNTQAVVDRGAANEGYPTASGSFARGAPGTAGGGGTDSDPAQNDENSGGGGGGNGGLGGRGGNAWNSNAPVGGFGGAGIATDAALMTLGGGGGAGSRNNSAGDESSGNAGGGIVMIRADSLTGTGTITADGLSANTADTTPDNDGGGGGGAGGSVLVYAPNGGFGGLTVNARGGRGSDAWPTVAATSYPGERHGPGGGGGGGRIFLSGTPAAAVVTAGTSGTTSVTAETYGASDGSDGTVSTGVTAADIISVDTIGACGPLLVSVVDLGITVTGPAGNVDPCSQVSYVFAVTNAGPDAAIDAVASFPVPANTTFQSLASPAGWSCSTPPSGGTGTASCTNPLFASGGSASFTLGVRVDCAAAPGTLLSITGSVATSSTDTYTPNNTTAMSNLVAAPIFVLTRASIRGLRVSADGLVEFATGWQQGTRGFLIYETNDPQGRLGLRRLTDELVPAPRPDSQTPLLYSVRTGPVSGRYLVIEELERSGRRNRLGPFPVGDERLARLFERVERKLERVGAQDTAVDGRLRVRGLRRGWGDRDGRQLGALRHFERPSSLVPTSLAIETSGTGVATVPRSALLGLGLPSDVPLARCKLTNAGRNVAFRVIDRGQPSEALTWDAVELTTTYTSRNVYVLTWSGPTPRLAVALTHEGDPPRAGFERVDRPALYVASVPQGSDPWLWDQLLAGSGPWPYDWDPTAGSFDLPGWPTTGAPVPVRLRFQGMTEHRHHVSVTLNGQPLGEVTFDGMSSGYLDATASGLRPAGNELRIEYAPLDGDPNAYAYLDYFEAARPFGFVPQAVEATPRPFDDSVSEKDADYLIVTHPDFADQAARLATAKRRQGLRVGTLDVLHLYDRWSAGIPEANAVAEEIRRMHERGARFVLLMGDDSFDPDDRTGLGARTFVPTLNGWDGVFGRVASENRYADVDGDGRPDLAIGRLPASTPDEAIALVAKVEQQQARLASVAGRQLYAVDNTGKEGFDFGAEARLVASRLPGTTVGFADLNQGIGPARAALAAGLASGAAFTHYFGHGGPQIWADEGLLTVEDAASIPGSGTVVLTWTCLSEFYQYVFGPSVNEALLLNPNAGALAAFGPAGITEAPLQSILYRRLYDELARGGTTLGEAIQRAKARAVAEDPRAVPVVEGWNLLGDPALFIQKP